MKLFKAILAEDSRSHCHRLRARVPECVLRSGDVKQAEFSAEGMVYNVQQIIWKIDWGRYTDASTQSRPGSRVPDGTAYVCSSDGDWPGIHLASAARRSPRITGLGI